MTFSQAELGLLAYADGFSLWQYETSDTSATVMGSGYFNSVDPIQILAAKDRIFCTASDATLTLEILTNDGSSITIRDAGIFHQPVFSDYLVPGLTVAKGADAPDLAELRDGIFLNAFAGTAATVEQAFFSVHILHDIKFNTTPTFHIHWTHNQGAPSGDVKWQIDCTISKGYSAGTYGSAVTTTTTQTAAAQYTHHITDDDDMPISITDVEPDSVILARIYRDPADAADTFSADAFLVNVDLHYVKSQIGTIERNRPFTSGGWS